MNAFGWIGAAAIVLVACRWIAALRAVQRREQRLNAIVQYLADYGETSGVRIAEELRRLPDPRFYDDLGHLVLQGVLAVRIERVAGTSPLSLYRLAKEVTTKGPTT